MNFARLAGLITLLGFALAGCKEKTHFIPDSDAGLVCPEGERLVSGICRFVCSRDGDCAAGERCNLFVGRCEPRPPQPDSGPNLIPCTTGAERCTADAKGIELCGPDSTWGVSQVCPGNGFCKNEKCLACQPGSTSCVPSDAGASTQVNVCLDDGSGLRLVTCATGATCTQGECRECTPGSTRCSPDSKSVQTCQKQQDETATWKWANTGDNLDGTCITQICELSSAGVPGCRMPQCLPGTTTCKNSTTQQVCSTTGSYVDKPCVAGTMGTTSECQNGVCINECDDAIAAKSYFGCEYWSANLDNSMDKLFKGGNAAGQGVFDSDFTFVVTNQSVNDATVTVWRYLGTSVVQVKAVTVKGKNDPSKGLLKIFVPWQSISPASTGVGEGITGRARYGYRLTSTRPIAVYQFSPIDAVKYTKTCTGTAGIEDCSCDEYSDYGTNFNCTFLGTGHPGICANPPGGGARRCSYGTFSNDASLLLPAHILGTSHVVVSPGHSHLNSPPTQSPNSGQMVVLATQDNTQVTVKASAVTLAGTGIPAFAKGEVRTFTLQSYEELQLSSASAGADLECITGGGGSSLCRKDNDLTGTVVTSDKPVAVFAGTSCLNVPYTRPYCDHVEEQIFPFATWGKSYVAVPSHPLRLNNQNFSTNPPPDHFKVVAGCPPSQCPTGTLITLSAPPSASAVLAPNNCLPGTSLTSNNCRLAGGSFVEFQSVVPFSLISDQPVAVAQFFPGQGQVTGAASDPEQGDPSMVLLPPSEQWRAKYTVLASTGLKDNYLGLAIDSTKVLSVTVDGTVVSGFVTVNGTNFQVKNHTVGPGTHTIVVAAKPGVSGLAGTGVTIYGYDAQVSYGYTGGLDLQAIVSGINPGG
jgi:hypothetical protein